MHKLVEQFLKLNSPTFIGAGDPEAATLWIQDLEKAFALLRCSEEENVVLVVYQLQGNVSTWWRATRGIVFLKGVVPEWNIFVEAFNGKYFSNCAREQKMAEFQCLRQGLMFVDQYKAKFAKLSHYAPRLIEDPKDKARRFRDGLRLELRDLLVPLNLKDYNEVYGRAQLIERNLNERAAASRSQFGSNRDGNRFGKKPMIGRRYPGPPIRKGGIGKSASSHNGVCCFCGTRHGLAPCHSRTGDCFECGQ
ncbi:hypothetical protein ACJRO7_021646 [Eucalyptus globulus]|uniref:Retrotransposon gag domain-containing protein n=1 Tax=Eucalyptus globulus TaxID=34317 RepID=A0ABD3KM77_EUCGL